MWGNLRRQQRWTGAEILQHNQRIDLEAASAAGRRQFAARHKCPPIGIFLHHHGPVW